MLIGYSRFSDTQFASANYSFRSGSDPLNSLRSDKIPKAGEAPYYKVDDGERNRWGDYSVTAVDPLDDTDLWSIQEYAESPVDGVDRWGTWWGRIVPPLSSIGNSPPIANAAAPEIVKKEEIVELDGSGSSDADGDVLTYEWAQTLGPTVYLSGANSAKAAFVAPSLSQDTVLEFQLTVHDWAASDTDSVAVTVLWKQCPPRQMLVKIRLFSRVRQ